MSQENMEVVRRIYDAVARDDTVAVLALYHPEVEVDASHSAFRDLGLGGVYRSHDGLRRFFHDYREPWESIEDDCEELIDAGEPVVWRASGAEVESRTQYGVWTIRSGKVVRAAWFTKRADAREDAGLSE